MIETGVDEFHVVSREERLGELEKLAKHCGFSYSVLENTVNRYDLKRFDRPI